ncbi:uncharacterized protein LOC111278062 [Durio zibethinus]|uniref:Uncharacterized protein LOC111278062 n=1 Tax=Durio zibethinus TaxID=66656 RepID=A0A6P5WX79_DURZI|nr:uncharacterized protein LOC111278062 [Durio zibethinus]
MDDEQHNSVPGRCPEFGAIFMSNNATKKECLRRKIFALPYSLSHFVKQVKDGMILFLFEFGRRELHGVFQACSDGAMNILPNVFSSSGKQLPAQVKFTPLWFCRPLSENEFRDAIRENYFSKNKFKFGLSEDQVRRLLSLFSLTRLKDQAPHRQLTRSKVARPSGYSTSKNRRLVDNDRSPMSNLVPGECNVDNNQGPFISTMHCGDSFYNDNGATADGRFGTYTDVGYEYKASAFLNECFQDLMGKVGGNIDVGEYAKGDRMEIEWNTGIELQPAVSVGYSSGNFRDISNDVRFAVRDRLETKRYDDDGFAPILSTAYPSSFQSKVNPLAYSSKHVLEIDSFIDDPTGSSSTFLPSMELENSNVSYPMTFEDSVVTTTLPYDPDVPSISYLSSSSLWFNRGRDSLQEYANNDSFVGNVLGSSTNQSSPSLLETRRTTITPAVNCGSRDFIPLPYSNQYECSIRSSPARHDYFDDLAAENSKKEGCGDLSLLKPSLASVPSSETRSNVRISEQPSSYRASLSKFPSLTFSDRYDTLLQDKHDCQAPERKNDAEFGNDGFMFKESQHHGDFFYNDNRAIEDGRFAIYKNVEYEQKEIQHQPHVHEPTNVDYHEVTSLSPAAYQNSVGLYPDCQKKRGGVFSRLALPPKAYKQERNAPPGTADIDTNASVNEVMDMIHRSRFHWVITRCKQLGKHHGKAANVRDTKQATRKEGLTMISKEMNVKPISLSKENSSQKTEETAFVNFKRRSSVRKNLEDGKTGNCCGSLNNKSASAAHCKKRKLIRADFCEFQSSDRGLATISKEMNDKPIPLSKENSSQKGEEKTFENFKHHGAVRKNFEDDKTGNTCESLNNKSASAAHCKKRKLIRPDFCEFESSDKGMAMISKEMNDKPISLSKENSSQKAEETTFVNFKRLSAVRKNFEDDKTGNHCESLNDKSASAAHCKKRKLIRPDFCENESPGRAISGDAPENVIAFSTDCSVRRNAKRIKVSVCCVNENDISQNVKLPNVMCQTAVGRNIPNEESGSNSEQFSMESFIASRNADEGGEESTQQNHSISTMTSVSCGVMPIETKQDLTTRDISMDGLSQDPNVVIHFTHESSPKICEDNDGNGVAKSEFFYNIELVNDLCPVGGEISISNVS